MNSDNKRLPDEVLVPYIKNFVPLRNKLSKGYLRLVYRDVLADKKLTGLIEKIEYTPKKDVSLKFSKELPSNLTPELLDEVIFATSKLVLEKGMDFYVGVRSKIDGKIKSIKQFDKQVREYIEKEKLKKLEENFDAYYA